ncbi:hypothetical protein HDU92_006223 [Lobulomyces angularis]|nr:hypothetical protein HDU92_006223 [Lobulomyces angularis]
MVIYNNAITLRINPEKRLRKETIKAKKPISKFSKNGWLAAMASYYLASHTGFSRILANHPMDHVAGIQINNR